MTGAARLFDPETSYQAARLISHGVEAEILRLFLHQQYGAEGYTDDELCEGLPKRHPPTIKSARSRLKNSNRLVDSGIRRPSRRGAQMIVWRLL